MTAPLCTHLIPEDQCLHCLSPALRVAIDALAQARAEITMLRAELNALRGYDPCASKDHDQAAAATRS